MKILWYSNAPWAGSGYGVQTAQVVKRLVADGHDVALAANYGLQGTVQSYNGLTVFPGALDAYSNDVLGGHARAWLRDEPGWLIGLFDTWVIDPGPLAPFNVAFWSPVDHTPVPPKVADFCAKHTTIAMSQYGKSQFFNVGIDALYAPHAFEGSVFKPTPSGIRAAMGVPDDAFLVTINAANKGNVPPRKAWHENIAALAGLMQAHDDVYAYLHTDQQGPGGIDLRILTIAAGIPQERLRWANQYAYRIGAIQPEELAAIYSASSILLACSYGEGFGVPTIEAQACGLPVIVSDFAASRELVGPGWMVSTQPFWDFSQAAWFRQPIIDSIRGSLEAAYEARDAAALRDKAVEFAAAYEADVVWDAHWRPILVDLERRLTPATRQQRRHADRKSKKGRAA